MSADELIEIRADLPAVEATAYLNAGTLGPLPSCAIEAMRIEQQYDADRRQCDRLWERLGEAQSAARHALTSLTGVGLDQVALMHTTHEAINTVLWGLDVGAGDTVVTTDEEHPGVLVPLRHLRDRTGIDVRIAPWHSDDAAFVESILRQVDGRTRAVVLSHVSWITGRIAPLRAIRDALPATCRIIVDGAQSAGVLVTDPASDGWDAYTVSGQKWPCGPSGSGGLALVDPCAWRPTFGAYMQVADPAHSLTSPVVDDGRRFETSQESMVPLAGFAASVEWLTTRVGVQRAADHARVLNVRARATLAPSIDAASLHGAAHLLCVDVPDATAEPIVRDLCRRNMSIRALSPARIRISFGCWTTPDEVDACTAAVAELVAQSRA